MVFNRSRLKWYNTQYVLIPLKAAHTSSSSSSHQHHHHHHHHHRHCHRHHHRHCAVAFWQLLSCSRHSGENKKGNLLQYKQKYIGRWTKVKASRQMENQVLVRHLWWIKVSWNVYSGPAPRTDKPAHLIIICIKYKERWWHCQLRGGWSAKDRYRLLQPPLIGEPVFFKLVSYKSHKIRFLNRNIQTK